jgi:arylamine N-acetyltransferase
MLADFLGPLPTSAYDRMATILAAFRRIPYENLTKIIRFDQARDPFRDAAELIRGFLSDGSGGTCFSIVNALQEVLAEAGIESRVVLADRNYGPDSHCALVARAEQREWLLDPGYLVFTPVPFPEGQVAAPGGNLQWKAEGDRLIAATVYPNGHRKIRYALKPERVGADQFRGAWRRSFEFEMMQYPVVTRIMDDGRHVYLRNGYLMENGRPLSTLAPDQIPSFVGSLGIRPQLAERALEILGSR